MDFARSTAQRSRLPGFHQLRGAEIKVRDMREAADGCDDNRAQQADDYDLQMSAPIRTVNGMVHWTTPVFYIERLLFGMRCDLEHTSAHLFKNLNQLIFFR